jgi:hypothetical protein
VIRHLLFLFELELPIAGHGYDVGGNITRSEPGGGGVGEGIRTWWIIAVSLLALITVGTLVSLNPAGVLAKLKAAAPKALILLVILAPPIAWTASSRGGGDQKLTVERWTALDGTPELLVSLGNKALNVLETTDGRREVRVKCVDRDGKSVLDAKQKWPFIFERGYKFAHAHQKTSWQVLQRADRCRLVGARIRLEASVSGALTR